MKPKASLRIFLALAGSSLLVISSAHADTVNWEGDTSSDWANADNWDIAPLTTDIANFNLATYGGNPVFAPDAGTTSIDGITIGADNGAMSLTTTDLSIGGSGISMANGAGAFTVAGGVTLDASQIWSNNSSSLLTANGTVNAASAGTNLELAGNGSFNFNDAIGSNIGNVNITSGAGSSVTFTTANTFTGNLHLFNGATLNFSAVNQLGSGTGSNYLAIQNGATFNYTGLGSESISGRNIYWNIGAANVDITDTGANLTLDLDTTGGNRDQTFNKGGAGTLTFTGTGAVYGSVNINNGTLKLSQTTAFVSPTTTVGASGTLELNKTATGFINRGTQLTRNITGDGTLNINSDTSGIDGGWVTLRIGGSNLVNFTGTINVKSGVLSMDNLNGTLTGNPDLNVEAGGLFGIRGQNISVDALTGDGDVMNDWNGATAGNTLTVGANNGSGTFSGVIHGDNSDLTDGTIEAGKLLLTKTGTGTQTLTGANTYSGLTTVANGTLLVNNTSGSGTGTGNVGITAGTLGGSGSISGDVAIGDGIGTADSILAPGTTGIGTLATGNLTFNSDGSYACDLDATSVTCDQTNVTGAVTIDPAATLSVSLTGSLAESQRYFIVVNDDVDAVSGTFSGLAQGAVVGNYGGTSLKISYTGDSGTNAITGGNDIVLYGAASSPYDTWAAGPFANPFTNTAPGVDFDNDGLNNLLEFVLGGDPTISQAGIAPVASTSGGNLVLTFKRSDASELAPAVTVTVELSTDLTFTTPADDILIGPASDVGPIAPSGASYSVSNSGGLDTITVLIPQGAAPKKFARVKAVQTP
jgi:autotransporter-associated beta strand protein